MYKVENFQKRATTYFPINNDYQPEVKIFFTYKGMPVNPQFIEEYPELYPSQEHIQRKFEELKKITAQGKTSFFTVTENGIEDVQVNSLCDLTN